jgi:hypothetical protein
LFTDKRPQDSHSANIRHLLRRWRHKGNILRKYTARQRNHVINKALKDIIRGIRKVKINKIYTSFFITENRFIRLRPKALREKDHIIMLKRCEFPVILRKKGRSAFCIVKACYLTRFMFREF